MLLISNVALPSRFIRSDSSVVYKKKKKKKKKRFENLSAIVAKTKRSAFQCESRFNQVQIINLLQIPITTDNNSIEPEI